MRPGDLVRYKYYAGDAVRTSIGILLGPCNPPSMWYTVLLSRGTLDCPPYALEVIDEAR